MIDRFIKRRASDLLQKAFQESYIVGLLGARQVGKSTLLKQLLPPERTLSFNFDSGEVRDQVTKNENYLLEKLEEKNRGPLTRETPVLHLCIDEAQKLPESFEIVKQLHDQYSPGLKIILSGSSSLLIKKRAAETLAGRIRFFYLHPFSLEEACVFEEMKDSTQKTPLLHEELVSGKLTENRCQTILRQNRHLHQKFSAHMRHWCLWGLMPSRLHFETESEWILLLRDYIDTYIDKDMRATERIGSLGDYKKLVRLMGDSIGNLVNFSRLASTIGIHRETVKEYLQILDESLLGFRLQAFSESIHRRITKAEKSYLIDNGLAYYFMDLKNPDVLEASGKIGALYENMIIAEFRKYASLLPAPLGLSYWRLSGINPPEVDLICEYRGNVTPVEIKCKSRIDSEDLRGLKTFLKSYAPKKSFKIPYGVLIYQGGYSYLKEEKIYLIPDWFLV